MSPRMVFVHKCHEVRHTGKVSASRGLACFHKTPSVICKHLMHMKLDDFAGPRSVTHSYPILTFTSADHPGGAARWELLMPLSLLSSLLQFPICSWIQAQSPPMARIKRNPRYRAFYVYHIFSLHFISSCSRSSISFPFCSGGTKGVLEGVDGHLQPATLYQL